MDHIETHTKLLWILLILIYMCTGTFSDMGKMSSPQNSFGILTQSQFNTKNNTRVIAQKGGLAVLPCVVKINSPATVSWIRRKDFQLLTVGLSTHSSDKRFLVEHTRHMGHWSLRIKSVREEDRGFYECQLSIYPTQSIFIELKVVEAVADITGAPDLHIDEGSTLRLECKLKRATENPAFVFWYHNNKMVNYDSQGGFSVTSTLINLPSLPESKLVNARTNSPSLKDRGSGSLSSINNHSSQVNSHFSTPALGNGPQPLQSLYLLTPSTSILTLHEVHFHHAGNYTCAPSNARSASITVHVLRGERPAAMQHANRSILDGENGNSSIITNGASSMIAISSIATISPLFAKLRESSQKLYLILSQSLAQTELVREHCLLYICLIPIVVLLKIRYYKIHR